MIKGISRSKHVHGNHVKIIIHGKHSIRMAGFLLCLHVFFFLLQNDQELLILLSAVSIFPARSAAISLKTTGSRFLARR